MAVEYHYRKSRKKEIAAGVVIIVVILGLFLFMQPVSDQTKTGQETPSDGETTLPPDETTPDNATVNDTTNATDVGNETTNATVNETTNKTSDVEPPANGMKAEYYSSIDLSGDPVFTGTIPLLDMSWTAENIPEGVDVSRFSAVFTGKVVIDKEGGYIFILKSDDGSRLFVDGTKIADIWDSTGVNSKSASRTLTAGEHDIRVDYKNIGGSIALLKLEYWASQMNITRQVIPQEKLLMP